METLKSLTFVIAALAFWLGLFTSYVKEKGNDPACFNRKSIYEFRNNLLNTYRA
jgi:hypothetical protein